MSQSEEVIQFNKNEIAAFSEFRSHLATLKHDNSKAVFNYADPKGNKEARSHIYKLRQTKSAVDKVRKEQKQESLDYGRRVDQQAKEISAEIEGMIEVHEVPLREIEAKEAARVAGIKERMAALSAYSLLELDAPAYMLERLLKEAEQFALDDSLEEFKAEAAIVKDASITVIKARIAARKKYEDEQTELEKLREQAAEQERKDHDAKIAQQAREEAERQAKANAEQMQRERDAEENRLKFEAEQSKREKLEAENRAKQAEENAKQAIKDAAERAERERLAKIEQEREEQEKRERNTKHKASINNAAVDTLIAGGIDAKTAKEVITLIAKGEVTNVTIRY